MVDPVASAQYQAFRLWQAPGKPDPRIPGVLVLSVYTEFVIHLFHALRNRSARVIGRNQITKQAAAWRRISVREPDIERRISSEGIREVADPVIAESQVDRESWR